MVPKRCSHHFTKKAKRMLFEETDNMVWRGQEIGIAQWCKNDLVFDEITEDEIEEIWGLEGPDDGEDRRLNVLRRRNKAFPKQFGGEETPEAVEHWSS